MEVNKDESTVTFKAAFRQWWNDTRLSWKKEDFGGVDRVWLVSGDNAECWLPDTIIREDAGDNYFSNFKDTEVRVNYLGVHYWSVVG